MLPLPQRLAGTRNALRSTHSDGCESIRILCLAEAPGSFAMYLRARYPTALIYGATRVDPDPTWQWHAQLLSDRGFIDVASRGVSGDVVRNADGIVNVVGTGTCDFVTADGGVGASNADPTDQERGAAELIAHEVHVATRVLAPGGTLIFKVFATLTHFSGALLWNTACCFETVQILHPAFVRPNNHERYVLCTGKRANFVIPVRGPLPMVLPPTAYPETFRTRLVESNDRAIRVQAEAHFVEALQEILPDRAPVPYDPLPDAARYLVA